MRSKRPRVTNPARPADRYALPGERIVEFSDDVAQAGGLISLMRVDGNDGRATLRVAVYSIDEDKVSVSRPSDAEDRKRSEDVRERVDRLRQTADELQAGTINPHHAANRIRKIANEIGEDSRFVPGYG
jgi:hypothetical protein